MNDQHYDYIICGGGCAGLSLAHRLTEPEFSHLRILVIDRDSKTDNDRTWSFWYQGTHRYSDIVHHSWTSISVSDREGKLVSKPIAPYTYQSIRGIDFYDYCLSQIHACDHVTWLQADIESVIEEEDGVVVTAAGERYAGYYAFDSLVRDFPVGDDLFTWQHFRGWVIETDGAHFDPDRATFMDFRMGQGGETRFVYVLPYAENKALVEATVFGDELYEDEVYDQMIGAYIIDTLSIDSYHIVEIESGKIPMTTASFGTHKSERIIAIGTRAGRVKPSSGYAFVRIQEECDQLIESIRSKRPRKVKKSSKFLAYDKTLLNVILTKKVSGKSVFTTLFEKNGTQRIMKFLDERTSLWEEIQLFRTLPFFPFLNAFIQENVLKR